MSPSRLHFRTAALLTLVLLLAAPPLAAAQSPTGNGAIFFHPDGMSASHWDAARIRHVGPDSLLNWDRLPVVAPYRGHVADQLTGTSNGGAVAHATGTQPHAASFGLDASGNEYRSADGTRNTVMEAAVEAGLKTALVQTGSIVEPGTAAFVAEASRRANYEEIALEVVESGVDVILGGGEVWLLPEGVEGRFGEGKRTDGRNLIEEAKDDGYTVVYTREAMTALPPRADKVLGVFAAGHTFRDRSEEELQAAGLATYAAEAPTVAEMTAFALERIRRGENGFLAVIEEEATDNVCNAMNASGCLTAMKRADDAIGVIRTFQREAPNTFFVTTSDSNANGLQVVDTAADVPVPAFDPESGAPMDGAEGTGTEPFRSAPDAEGRSFPFAIAWAHGGDVGSGVLARAAGLGAEEKLPATGIRNVDVYRVLYNTLFGPGALPEAE